MLKIRKILRLTAEALELILAIIKIAELILRICF